MFVSVLGPVTAARNDIVHPISSQRAREVLAVLHQRRSEAVPGEVLLDLVWGSRSRELTVGVVHTIVARLRRQLGSDLVETQALGYRLGRSVTSDEDAFEALVGRGRQAGARGDVEDAVGQLRSALDVWSGPIAYAGVSDSLVRADRVRLANQHSAATEELAAHLLDAGSLATAHECFELTTALAQSNPLREQTHALAMRAAYRCGRQGEALQIYRALRRRLRDELGVEPSPVVIGLQQQILEHDPRLDAPAAPASTVHLRTSTSGRRARVAAPTTPTVGRTEAVADVLTALAAGWRLISIVGPGGVGKSRLLAEVALGLDDGTPSAYLDLSGLGEVDMDELADAVARATALPDPGAVALDALISSMRAVGLVLLIDEAEWALGSVTTLVRAILAACPAVRVVLTSRIPLGVGGERQMVLPPLDVPTVEHEAGEVLRSSAVRLLLDRLSDHVSDLALSDDDVMLLGTIARRVDGLPLALEIVAGYGASRTVAELLALVEAPLDVGAQDRGRQARHRSLRDTLAWSLERLNADQRMVLARLAPFAGPFDLEAAAAVVGDPDGHDVGGPDSTQGVPAIVRSLAREALIQVDRAGPRLRFRMLRTVRDLAVEASADSGDLTGARLRHRQWFAERWRGQPRSDDLIEDVRLNYDDYVEALRGALEERDGPAAGDLVLTLTRFWLFGSWNGPGVRWTTRALDSGVLAPLERARVQVQRASLALALDPGMVVRDSAEAAPVLEAEGDDVWLVTAYTARALERYGSGDRAGSVESAATSVEVARGTSPERLADALGVQALALAADGAVLAATAAVDEAMNIVAFSGSTAARISVCSNLALALIDTGHYRRALTMLDSLTAEVKLLLGRPPDFFVLNLGWAALGCDQVERASDAFRSGLGEGAAVRADRHTAEGYAGLACATARAGSADGPAAMEAARELASRVGLVMTPGQQLCIDRAVDLRPGPPPHGEPFEPWTDVELVEYLYRLTVVRHP